MGDPAAKLVFLIISKFSHDKTGCCDYILSLQSGRDVRYKVDGRWTRSEGVGLGVNKTGHS